MCMWVWVWVCVCVCVCVWLHMKSQPPPLYSHPQDGTVCVQNTYNALICLRVSRFDSPVFRTNQYDHRIQTIHQI